MNIRNVLAIALLLCSSTASATMFYTDEISWLTDTGGPTAAVTFEGVAANGSVAFVASPYTEAGVDVTNAQIILDDQYNGGQYDVGTGAVAQIYLGATSTISLSNSAPLYAGGLTLFTVGPDSNHASDTVRLTLSNGDFFDVVTPATNGDSVFVGFTTTEALTSFSVAATSTLSRYLVVDNILVNDIQPEATGGSVPVPPTVTLLLFGLLASQRFVRRAS